MELKKLTFKTGDREIELTEQEARELRNELNKLFGQPVYMPYPVYPTYPSPSVPEYPFGPSYPITTCEMVDNNFWELG